MSKYFYTDGVNKFGPFSKDDLKIEKISRSTKVWRFGMDSWTELSSVSELEDVLNSIPPEIRKEPILDSSTEINEVKSATHQAKERKRPQGYKWIIGGLILIIVQVIIYAVYQKQIKANSYTSDEDFDLYVNKFYRDLEYFGIFPKKPTSTIIKFSRLDQLDQTTHIHALTFGNSDDDKIEIYINPSTWKRFNKPMKYFLMYHELAHDQLDLKDLEINKLNEGKLMYPELSSYERKDMDDFIESAHATFEEKAK